MTSDSSEELYQQTTRSRSPAASLTVAGNPTKIWGCCGERRPRVSQTEAGESPLVSRLVSRLVLRRMESSIAVASECAWTR